MTDLVERADIDAASAARADMLVGGFQGDPDVWRKVEQAFAKHRIKALAERDARIKQLEHEKAELVEAIEGCFEREGERDARIAELERVIIDERKDNGARYSEAMNECNRLDADRDLLQMLLARYGDRVAMANSARPEWQQAIDDALSRTLGEMAP